MADKDYSLVALEQFLDFASSKGLVNKNTAQSRKAATKRVLGVLDEAEQADIRGVNIDHAFDRFQNIHGTSYTPDSLQVYKSRTRAAVSDFLAYRENPSEFKPGGAQRLRTPKKKSGTQDAGGGAKTDGPSVVGAPQSHPSRINVPVPLRQGLVVSISNLPPDLSKAEAARLAAIIQAYAVIEEG